MSLKALVYIAITLFFWSKTVKNPIYGISFFAGIVFIRPETLAYRQLDAFHIPLVTSSICLLSYFINKGNLKKPIETNVINVLSIFLFFAFISYALSDVIPLWRWMEGYLKITIFCFLLNRIITDVEKFDLFILAILLGFAFLSLWGVDQHFRGNARLEGVGGNEFTSNDFGAMLALVFPFFFYKALGKLSVFKEKIKKRVEIVFFAATLPFVVLSIQFTESRGAFLGFCTSILVILLRAKKKLKIVLIAPIALPIIFSLLPADYRERIGTIFNPNIQNYADEEDAADDGEEVDGSVRGRIDFWKAGMAMFGDHPICGVGLENAALLMPSYTNGKYNKPKDIHNMPIKILAEIGILGFVVFYFMVIMSFKNLRFVKKHAQQSHSEKLYYYKNAIEAGLAGYLVSALTGSYLYIEIFYWMIMLTASLKMLTIIAIDSKSNVT